MQIELHHAVAGLHDEVVVLDVTLDRYRVYKHAEYVTFGGMVYKNEGDGVFLSIHPVQITEKLG